jgi:predicted ATPase/DNA-binding CsgD family transcriptional regulator
VNSVRALAAANPHAGVPLAPNPLLGRGRELAYALRLLQSPSVHLLTLTGPPGVGKTRLAMEIAHELRDVRPQVHFVDLSQLRDAAQVPGDVGASLLHTDLSTTEPTPISAEADSRVLFVLDTFEHVRPAAEWLAEVLATVPGIQFLVTSRVRLRLRWERVLVLQPLPVPADPAHASPKSVARSPSVALYVERAKMADATFRLTTENAEVVATFAARVEGVPLALELAASQVNVLPPQQLSTGFEPRRLLELGGNWGHGPERHQSLGASLDWSYQLLDAADQVVFRRLGVFDGGWSLEAASAVCGDEVVEADMLAILSRLIDANLVQVTRDSRRFSMLEITREFALQRFEAMDDITATRTAHATWYAELASEAASHLHDTDQRVWLRALDEEHDNCVAALAWSLDHATAELSEQLAGGLGAYWWATGNYRLAKHWLAAVARQGAATPRIVELAVLAAAWLGDGEAVAQRLAHQTLENPEPRLVASQAAAAWAVGQADRARSLIPQNEAARAFADRSIADFAAWGGGMLLLELGELERAATLLRESRDGCQADDDAAGIVRAHLGLASLAHRRGERERAATLLAEALPYVRHVDLAPLNAWIALLTLQLGVDGVARSPLMGVLGALESTRVDGVLPLPPVLLPSVAGVLMNLREPGGSDAPTAEEPTTIDEFVEACLGCLRAVGAQSDWPLEPPRADDGVLSPREQDVIRLVAEGATNKEIAATLQVAETTARFHVASLLSKLGATNRTQAVTLARRRGVL